jgi:hypothetical protein
MRFLVLMFILCTACHNAGEEMSTKEGITVTRLTMEMTRAQMLGIRPLLPIQNHRSDLHEALNAVAQELKRTDEEPSEFFIKTEYTPTTIIFHLWHRTALTDENFNQAGNPGGKCRDMVVDRKEGQVIETQFWQ